MTLLRYNAPEGLECPVGAYNALVILTPFWTVVLLIVWVVLA